MPIYQYNCPDCGYNFEVLQKLSDDPISICPNCNKATVTKIVSLSNFQLKGGGWYKTIKGE